VTDMPTYEQVKEAVDSLVSMSEINEWGWAIEDQVAAISSWLAARRPEAGYFDGGGGSEYGRFIMVERLDD